LVAVRRLVAISWSGAGKSKQRLRSALLKIGGDSNTPRSTLFKISIRGMVGSLTFKTG
jgi:hypothetical protein